jgi:16S rRNA C1402 (ribose-2'-O) methylase RsmI
MNGFQNKTVTFERFLSELEKENAEMQRATQYRQTTAKMALDIVKQVRKVDLFETRERAYKTLKAHFLKVYEERLLDVAKFLSVIFNELEKWANLPDPVRALLDEKAKNRKPLSFEPVM